MGQDVSDFRSILEGNYSVEIVLMLIKKIAIGLISFTFTPHPINYYVSWVSSMGSYGSYNIYTGVDNVLIILGSIYAYIIVLPLTIYYFMKWKRQNLALLFFIIMYVMIYVIAYIGVTDIRNRHFAFFFILIGLITSSDIPKRRELIKPLFLSLCVLFGIMLISSGS